MKQPGNSPVVVCFGEILWDCLPRGLFLGGAPLNVAYHLSRHGCIAVPFSAVGADFLGREAVRRIAAWGVRTEHIALRPRDPTGTVEASLDARGSATYSIRENVAWDRIPADTGRFPAGSPAALVHGTLALRSARNRQTLTQLFRRWPDALRVVDLNLRAPFDAPSAVRFALAGAQLLKLNDHELGALLQRRMASPATLETGARKLAERFAISKICVTAGSRGAGLLWDGFWHWADARPIAVRDTIGAGDAFLGALLAGVLRHRLAPPEALARACRVAEFVATQDGATPEYHADFLGRVGLQSGKASRPLPWADVARARLGSRGRGQAWRTGDARQLEA